METIDDIIREMRGAAKQWAGPAPLWADVTLEFAHRIEAAKRREEDIALLRAAIAPILAIPTDALTGLWGVSLPDGGMMLTPEGLKNAMRFIEAVRECKRIYGEEDEG